MSIHAILEPPSSLDNRRGAQRLRMRLEVPGSTDPDNETTVIIHNLSATGLLIETRSDLAIGQGIRLEMPEVEAVHATIIWRSMPLFGCRFDRPLSRRALSAARLRNPLPADVDPVGRPNGPSADEPLSARLLRIRRELGLSRAALSTQTGLSMPSIWAWETGRTIPRRASLSILANAFGMSEQHLVMGGFAPNAEVQGGAAGQSDMLDDMPGEAQQSIKRAIHAAKREIATLAGISPDCVKIIIEY